MSSKIEIVTIGDEVLLGYTLNSNARFLSQLLLEAGYLVTKITTVGDDPELAKKVLIDSLSKESLVITTGGLGPTIDDHTRQIVADLFQVQLKYEKHLEKELKNRFGNLPTLTNQATVIESAKLLTNELGSAYGFIMENKNLFGNASLIAFPGVPQELYAMATRDLIPFVTKKIEQQKRFFVSPLHYFRLTEADVDPALRILAMKYPDIEYGIYPSYGTLTVHLKALAKNEEQFQTLIRPAYKYLMQEFGKFLFSSPSGAIDEALHEFLKKNHITVATAESCTGGAVASRLVRHAGASTYLKGGVIAYSNEAKATLLDVQNINIDGAVSEQVTEKMARSVQKKLESDAAIAVSGILGPTGATSEKPVGTICISILFKNNMRSWTTHFRGNREVIFERTIQHVCGEFFYFLRELYNKVVLNK